MKIINAEFCDGRRIEIDVPDTTPPPPPPPPVGTVGTPEEIAEAALRDLAWSEHEIIVRERDAEYKARGAETAEDKERDLAACRAFEGSADRMWHAQRARFAYAALRQAYIAAARGDSRKPGHLDSAAYIAELLAEYRDANQCIRDLAKRLGTILGRRP